MKYTILWTAVLGLSLTSQALTLDEALEIARKNSPRLRASHADEQAARRSVEAAGLWSNPELEFEGEGLGGDNNGTDSAEYTAMISQEFPMFGKKRKSRAVASYAADAAQLMVVETELDLAAQVRAVFAEALAQQEIAKVRDVQEKLGHEFVAAAKARHEEGSASELELVQADLALEEIRMEKQCCFGDLDSAKRGLASLLGVSLEAVGTPIGNLYELEESNPLMVDDAHPALQRLRAEESMARAEAALARSEGAGNLSLGAGVKYEAIDDVQSFVVAASVPLSIRKKGRVESAAALLRAEAVSARCEQVRRDLQQQLDQTVQAYNRASEKSTQYKTRMLPKAEQAYALSRKGYNAGRYSWMELLAAQQNLAGIQIRMIEAMLDAQKASAELSKFKTGE